MSIDLLPFSASAPESSGAGSRHRGSGPTLTLPLELTPVHAAFEPSMSGTVHIDEGGNMGADTGSVTVSQLRAAVVPASGCILTITF